MVDLLITKVLRAAQNLRDATAMRRLEQADGKPGRFLHPTASTPDSRCLRAQRSSDDACRCALDGIQNRFTAEEYMALEKSGKENDEAATRLLTEVVTDCRDEGSERRHDHR